MDWAKLERWLLAALDDEPGVLAELEGEWIALREQQDPLPALLVASLAAQIVVTSFGNLTPLRKWVDRLVPALTLEPADPLARLQLASGLLCRMDFGDAKGESGQHGQRVARMGREAMAGMRLAGDWPHPNLALAAGEQLPGHYAQTGENAHGSVCVDEQVRLAAHPGVDPRLSARAIYWSAAALRLLDDIPRSQEVYAHLKESTAGLDWRWLKFQRTTMEGRPAFDEF